MRTLIAALTVSLALGVGVAGASAEYHPGIPPDVDPGTPVYAGSSAPLPAEPARFDPRRNTLRAIFDADAARGGTSFWVDRVLERPFLSNGDSYLYTRGRALYMYTHNPSILGFAGGYAYRERPTGANQSLYTVSVSDATLAEDTSQRKQYPSRWESVHTATGLRVAQKKFITYDDVAVTLLTLTNTGGSPTTRTLTVSSPIATSAEGAELTGSVTTRYGLTVVTPRLSGSGMSVSGSDLARTVTLDPGESTTVKVQMGVTARELAASRPEYERYRRYDPQTALRAHVREYNRWWVENVPYIDVPDENVKKMSYYRTFLSRFNSFDGNIPGNDFQFPVSIEGVLGYNNAIQLTQPMHMQDLKYFRNALYSYGDWVSSGESSKCTAFTDNPGNTANWNNTYEQYIAREALNAYKVHGGERAILNNLARYAECDVKGQLAKYDQNDNSLIAYAQGFLTGNDADAVALAFYGGAQDRTESAFWYSGARASAQAYALLGKSAKAAEMNAIADKIRDSILNRLWDDAPAEGGSGGPAEVGRVPGVLGNALRLGDVAQYVSLPSGIVSGLDDFTISTWVNPAQVGAWSRVFDFGTGTNVNMFLTVSAGGGPPRFAITTGGGGAEQRIDAPAPLEPNRWTHLAVTLSGTTGTLYVNGSPVATNPNLTLRPSSLGETNQNWIGRSQYGDPTLNAAVDDFQIYDHALSADEVRALGGPGPTPGAGDVASYRFDESDGTTAVDSSDNGRDGTIATLTFSTAGKVFKQRDVARDALVPWKDQQNFSPFTESVVPDTPDFEQALRFYASRDEFPIMPFYTADQHDKADAEASGKGGSNNFSNINSTLQAQLYAKALRDYPSQYVTPDMYRRLLEWLTWTQYVGADNRYPDNNEFFFNWNPETKTFGRSGIHHNILGAYNFMLIDDIAGVRPRLDDALELWPIDVGYDHFAVGDLSYHGKDLTVVWDRPRDSKRYYEAAPEGFSAYLDGRRAFTVSDLAHVTWTSRNGKVSVRDGSATRVTFSAHGRLDDAPHVRLAGNARVADMFQKAGVDLASRAENLAAGRPTSASFTTTTPSLQATAPENAVDGFTISGLPVQAGSYVARNPIWGTLGSPNAQDWLEVDLGRRASIDTVKLFFYSNKSFGVGGNTYREPASYTVQYFDGGRWVDAPGQARTPAAPLPNYNSVEFPRVRADRLRVLMAPRQGFGMGLKEVQVFRTRGR